VKHRRWDTDERGRGIASGAVFAPGVHELAEVLALEDWIAEKPEAHLLPHIEQACAQAGLELLEHRLEGAVFVVRIAWTGPIQPDEARTTIVALVGSFAESATSVRQRGLSFEVVTGMLDPDTPFKSHGHLVRLELIPHA
jgi:hypothetical protein